MRSPRHNPIVIKDFDSYCANLADAYDQLPDVEESELWRWQKLADHINKFYKRILSRVDVEFVDGQPYESAEQMREEVSRTGVMLISTDFNEHPIFDEETNLKFRAVHDYVVHIIPGDQGPDFSQRGEMKAYNLHRRLAPPDTWPALFTEVAAQACYANARGEFPVQKVAVIPGFDLYNVGEYDRPDLERREAVANPRRTKGQQEVLDALASQGIFKHRVGSYRKRGRMGHPGRSHRYGRRLAKEIEQLEQEGLVTVESSEFYHSGISEIERGTDLTVRPASRRPGQRSPNPELTKLKRRLMR